VKKEPVAAGGVEDCGGQQESGEGVEAQGFAEVAVEERGEGTGGSAAGAEEMQVGVDGAARIEGVLLRREAEQESGGECDDGERCSDGGGGCEWAEGGAVRG
jgi:hypothetical protein